MENMKKRPLLKRSFFVDCLFTTNYKNMISTMRLIKMKSWKENNFMNRFRESLPIEDRDAYNAWKDKFDYENSDAVRKKAYKTELGKRNSDLYDKWSKFLRGLDSIYDARAEKNPDLEISISQWHKLSSNSVDEGYIDETGFVSKDCSIQYVLGVYLEENGSPVKGDLLDDVIPKIKKHNGLDITVTLWTDFYDDDYEFEYSAGMSKKQAINFITKCFADSEGRAKAGFVNKTLKSLFIDEDYSYLTDGLSHVKKVEARYENKSQPYMCIDVLFHSDVEPNYEIPNEISVVYDRLAELAQSV